MLSDTPIQPLYSRIPKTKARLHSRSPLSRTWLGSSGTESVLIWILIEGLVRLFLFLSATYSNYWLGSTASEYVTGFVRCQQEWLRQYALPRFTQNDGSTPEEHIEFLERGLSATQTLMPNLQWPVLWHPDLHRANILVTDTAPYTITGLIDWQYTCISPFFNQISVPKAFQYTGSRVQFVRDCLKPPLPENLDSLSEEEKKLTLEERFDAGMHAFYEQMTKNVPNVHALLTQKYFGTTMQPFCASHISWQEGLQTLQLSLGSIYAQWEDVTGGDATRRCPFEFSRLDFARLTENHQRFLIYQKNVDSLRRELGCFQDGWVPAELFDEALAKSKQLEAKWNEVERGGAYPLRDRYTPLMT